VEHLLVALGDLVRTERRAAARAVGHALVAPVEEPALVHLLEQPPHALDVLRRVRDVRPRVIEPVADPLGEALPVLLVGPDALAADLVEASHAHFLDLALAADPELLLRLDLDRQPVRVPPRDARHVATPHRLVAADQVLDRTADHVVDPRPAVRRRRTLV